MFKTLYHQGIPDAQLIARISVLYEAIFEVPMMEKVVSRFHNEPDVLVLIICDDTGTDLGYKIGYRKDNKTFYSWIGGVLPQFRGVGLGRQLMLKQHEWCTQQGYEYIETKTMNRWRNMLILNLQCGFEITGVYTDGDGIKKILMQKKL